MAKILLVEDDSNLREIYGARLEAEGYTIISASDGEEALAVAVRERPDLIISDIMMPRISGFDMLDILRQTPETKDIKVIVMTALSQDEDRERGKQLGADHYMVKSQVTLDDVVSTVKGIIPVDSSESEATADPHQPTPPASRMSETTPDQVVDNTMQPPSEMPPLPSSNANTGPVSLHSPQDDLNSTPVNPRDMDQLNREVEQSVASSPLMNGAPPTPQSPPAVAPAPQDSNSINTAPSPSQPDQPQPPVSTPPAAPNLS